MEDVYVQSLVVCSALIAAVSMGKKKVAPTGSSFSW
jgi:hypothetical protein